MPGWLSAAFGVLCIVRSLTAAVDAIDPLVVSGKVLIVEDRNDDKGEPVVAGSLVGELAMIIETRAVTTVVARSSVRAFRIPRRQLRVLMETDPDPACGAQRRMEEAV